MYAPEPLSAFAARLAGDPTSRLATCLQHLGHLNPADELREIRRSHISEIPARWAIELALRSHGIQAIGEGGSVKEAKKDSCAKLLALLIDKMDRGSSGGAFHVIPGRVGPSASTTSVYSGTGSSSSSGGASTASSWAHPTGLDPASLLNQKLQRLGYLDPSKALVEIGRWRLGETEWKIELALPHLNARAMGEGTTILDAKKDASRQLLAQLEGGSHHPPMGSASWQGSAAPAPMVPPGAGYLGPQPPMPGPPLPPHASYGAKGSFAHPEISKPSMLPSKQDTSWQSYPPQPQETAIYMQAQGGRGPGAPAPQPYYVDRKPDPKEFIAMRGQMHGDGSSFSSMGSSGAGSDYPINLRSQEKERPAPAPVSVTVPPPRGSSEMDVVSPSSKEGPTIEELRRPPPKKLKNAFETVATYGPSKRDEYANLGSALFVLCAAFVGREVTDIDRRLLKCLSQLEERCETALVEKVTAVTPAAADEPDFEKRKAAETAANNAKRVVHTKAALWELFGFDGNLPSLKQLASALMAFVLEASGPTDATPPSAALSDQEKAAAAKKDLASAALSQAESIAGAYGMENPSSVRMTAPLHSSSSSSTATTTAPTTGPAGQHRGPARSPVDVDEHNPH